MNCKSLNCCACFYVENIYLLVKKKNLNIDKNKCYKSNVKIKFTNFMYNIHYSIKFIEIDICTIYSRANVLKPKICKL